MILLVHSMENQIYPVKGIIQFHEQDMFELYDYFYSIHQTIDFPEITSICVAIDNILRADRNSNMRDTVHSIYELNHVGHIEKINTLSNQVETEINKLQSNLTNDYIKVRNEFDSECTKAVKEYFDNEQSIIDLVQNAIYEYAIRNNRPQISIRKQ